MAAAFRNGFPGGCVLAALVLLGCSGMALADPPADKPESQPRGPELPVLTTAERARQAALMLVGDGGACGTEVFTELAVLTAGEEQRLWTFHDPNFVRKIDAWKLEFVKDNTSMSKEVGDQEQDAYFDMLIFANQAAPAALDKAANEEGLSKDDLWAQLFRNPVKYRGHVVHFDGKLKKLRRFDPQAMAEQAGVENYYEGYLVPANDAFENDPVFIVFTDLPKGLEPAEKMDAPVSFSGYFFKIFRYTAADTKDQKKDRLAPLLIGRTVTLLPAAALATTEAPVDTNWPVWLGPLFFGAIGLTVGLLFMLGYWYRSGDRHVRGRVSAVRHGDFIAPPPDAPTDGSGSSRTGETAASAPPSPRNRLSEGPGDLPRSDT